MPDESFDLTTDSGIVDMVGEWLKDQALGEVEVEALVDGCCNRLLAAGIPLWRVLVSFRTLHPLYARVWLIWRRGEGMGVLESMHGRSSTTDAFRQSPFFHMIESGIPYLRRRLVGDRALLDFPVLEEFRDEGATDYLASLVPFTTESYTEDVANGITASWATDRDSGFSNQDIRSLKRIEKQLAVTCKVMINDRIARNVVDTYLGPVAGRQVLKGAIRRGDGESIHAVLWYCDMRESTRLASALPARDLLALLNTYFECTAGAVMAEGGEVLLLLGDAVLAIFPIQEISLDSRRACEQAMAAAALAGQRIAEVNTERQAAGQEAIEFGLGLHVGDVMYGNIGVPERLQFTVVGPAANEVARIEGLTKELGQRILASKAFVTSLPDKWQSMGQFELKGLAEAVEVFAPPEGD